MANDRAVVSFRVSSDELSILEAAAEAARESLSEFVRKAALLRAGGGMLVRVIPNTSFVAPYTHTDITDPKPSNSAPRTVVQDEFVRAI